MLRGTGRELPNQRSKITGLPAPGYTRTYTERKAILRMPRIGTSVRASLRAAVRFERNGLRLQKLSSANVHFDLPIGALAQPYSLKSAKFRGPERRFSARVRSAREVARKPSLEPRPPCFFSGVCPAPAWPGS